jgi:hypothetical protein
VGDGTTKYLNSNRNNNADPQNSNHNAIYVFTADTSGNKVYIGAGVDTNEAGTTNLGVLGTGDMFFRNRNGGATSITAANSTTGFVGTSRSNAGNYTIRRIGSDTNAVVTSQVPYNGSVFVFATTNGIIPAAA